MQTTWKTGDLPRFLDWMKEFGIRYNADALEIRATYGRPGDHPSIAVFARRPLVVGEEICTIPKGSLLTPGNSDAADMLSEAKLGGGLALVVALMIEYAREDKSPWAGYLQMLNPKGESIPLLWRPGKRHEGAALAALAGTEAAARLAEDRHRIASDYEEHVAPLLKKNKNRLRDLGIPPHRLNERAFAVASSWVGSRAFHVDEEMGGSAMVPLADAYNHATCVETVHIEGLEDGDDDDDDDDADAEDDDNEPPSLVPIAQPARAECGEAPDALGAAPAGAGPVEGGTGREVAEGIETGAGLAADLLEEGMGESEGPSDNLSIRVIRECGVGEEAYNTYGELGPATLLYKYGFVEDEERFPNPFLTVALEWPLLEGILGGASFREQALQVASKSREAAEAVGLPWNGADEDEDEDEDADVDEDEDEDADEDADADANADADEDSNREDEDASGEEREEKGMELDRDKKHKARALRSNRNADAEAAEAAGEEEEEEEEEDMPSYEVKKDGTICMELLRLIAAYNISSMPLPPTPNPGGEMESVLTADRETLEATPVVQSMTLKLLSKRIALYGNSRGKPGCDAVKLAIEEGRLPSALDMALSLRWRELQLLRHAEERLKNVRAGPGDETEASRRSDATGKTAGRVSSGIEDGDGKHVRRSKRLRR
ncbi:hypothetical protein CYMTET_39404 [Cymbomonas tetramitiformis]|uniref:SET domain-containing protein n=1 Tax=Cymbomonas tetramitiformis TaxID=36881 RepID=A0AAE0CBB9_9CHLO|nr:hypothetical protein CYMTET_39404 [Cymbomonas tetramitiformis]